MLVIMLVIDVAIDFEFLRDQAGDNADECSWIGLGDLIDSLCAMLSPCCGQIAQEGFVYCISRALRPSFWVSGLTWLEGLQICYVAL
jgi:hypothetical protein